MKKVVVGISGGVDSSSAAALLLEKGYEVIGITFKFTEAFDETDAIEVCKKLNIEHHILDYKEIFKEKVIDKFINDYKNGLTPNPCILCNREIKFNFLYKAMIDYNADYIATGHYAKIIDGKLYKSSDLLKDQTYFLSQLKKEQLEKLILPLEGLTKDEVRNIANKYNLITANKKDSYDVCFITNTFKEYMNEVVETNIGNVINVENNEIIGKHNGLNNYTIGQRKGLNIGGTTDRMYVVGKDISKNILYIALGDNNDHLISTSCLITNLNLINKNYTKNTKAKFRYRQNEINVELEPINENEMIVHYQDGVKSVTPGQICAIYIEDECIGSGIIKEVRKDNKKLRYL